MTPIQAILLGLVQGLTEFLPVSSSGHLIIWERLLGAPPGGLTFSIALHLGSLAAVVAVFWGDWVTMARGAWHGIRGGQAADSALLIRLIVATIPIAIAGLLLRDVVEQAFESPYVLGSMLIVTAVLLWRAESMRGRHGIQHVSLSQAWRIGLGQALALLPGLSRSGVTLTFGMFVGLDRPAAARFAFLLAVPAIFGAALVQGLSLFKADDVLSVPVGSLALGMITSAVASYAAVRLLFVLLKPGRFIWFARYVFVLGIVVLVGAATRIF